MLLLGASGRIGNLERRCAAVSAWPSSTGSAVVYLSARWQSDQSDPWQWRCGFYPEPDSGECTSGTAASFESARAAFTGGVGGVLVQADGSRLEGLVARAGLDSMVV